MKKFCFFGLSFCLLVLGLTGCAGKGAKWVCTKNQDGYVSNHCNWGSSETTTQKTVVAPVVEKKEVVAPVVVVKTPEVKVEAPKEVVAPVVVKAPEASIASVPAKGAYDFGDFKSSTLTTKAWQALAASDTDAVLAYTNKCISMYGEPAAKMQKGLTDYPTGDSDKIFSYWAVNDVATSLYIQGEALRKAKRTDEAKDAFTRIANEFSYGQTYDVNNKSFWKPADAAKDSLYMIDHKVDLDFGNMTSNYIVSKMWKSLADKNLDEVIGYDMKLEHLYRQEALDMQKSLKAYPQMPAENIHSNWALNDVGTGAFILGEAYRTIGNNNEEAIKAYKRVVNDYLYAQCWDPQGWFWKVSEAAQKKITELEPAK